LLEVVDCFRARSCIFITFPADILQQFHYVVKFVAARD
jgi:hypothetical protein